VTMASTSGSGETMMFEVGASGTFPPVTISPGTYYVWGRSPDYMSGTQTCTVSSPVSVYNAETTRIVVVCQVK
jgi:hypothetical protein